MPATGAPLVPGPKNDGKKLRGALWVSEDWSGRAGLEATGVVRLSVCLYPSSFPLTVECFSALNSAFIWETAGVLGYSYLCRKATASNPQERKCFLQKQANFSCLQHPLAFAYLIAWGSHPPSALSSVLRR